MNFDACLKVEDSEFYSHENVQKRVEAIKAKIAFMGNKTALFYKLAELISPIQISRADFEKLKSAEKTSFLADYLGDLSKENLRKFFEHKPLARL